MNGQIWIYWFPVALASGLAGVILGRRRGVAVSAVGAVYWLALSTFGTAPAGLTEWLAALGGAVVIIWLGLSMAPAKEARPAHAVRQPEPQEPDASREIVHHTDTTPFERIVEIVESFSGWLAANRNRPDPWPEFGEFVRSALYDSCGATHVRPYRLLAEDDQLYPLRLMDPEERDFPSARGGIIGHVVTTGKSYRVGDLTHGPLVDDLAQECDDQSVWCFAIRSDHHTIGVVRVGAFQKSAPLDFTLQRALEAVLNLCWITLTETCRGRLAGSMDPVSGVFTFEAFMEAAKEALEASYEDREPVAVIHVGVEGIRSLWDSGRWDRANEALFEVSSLLKQRVRQDDVIGALDGSSFLLVLRRVDSELASLIVRQLADRCAALCADAGRWGDKLHVRFGVAGTGLEHPPLRRLLSRAMENCHEARRQGVNILTDVSTGKGVLQ